MKAIHLNAYGNADQLQLAEAKEPAAGAGEVVIKIAAVSLNPADSKIRQGFLAEFIPLDLPAILGFDGAGTIVSVGPDVTGFEVGDRVIVFLLPNGKGTYAERVVAPVSNIAKLPENVSFEAGATLPLVGLTARQSVDALGVSAGDRVLVSGALGGVGRAAVQYLKELGATPVAGVRKDRLTEGRQIAGDAVDITATPTSPEFDFAVSTAEPVAGNLIQFVRDGGKIATIVGTPDDSNQDDRVTIFQIFADADPDMLTKIADAAGRGDFTVPIAQTFQANQASDAHRALDSGPRGKLVIVM